MKKGITAIILAAILLATAFAGCQKGPDSATGTESPADSALSSSLSASEAAAVDSSEPVEIQWLAYNTYAQPNENAELIKLFEEKYNAKFQFWYIDDQNWDEVLGVRLTSGEMPDMLRIKDSSKLPSYVKQGVLAEITDEMLAKIPSYTSYVQKNDPDGTAFIDAYYNGKLYLFKEPNPQGGYPTSLIWRTDWLKKLGIDKIPSTIDEFETAIYKFANEDPDGDNIKNTFGFSNTVMNAVFGAYGPIPLKEFRGAGTQNLFYMMKDGKIDFAATQPEMKEALAKLQQWYADGVIDPEFVTGENKGGYWAVSQDFENGKVGVTGMALSSHWNPPLGEAATGAACYESFLALNPDMVWGETVDIGASITGPKGASGTHTWGMYGSSGFSITTECVKDQRKLDMILTLVEDMNSDFDTFLLGEYGIKDVHYTIDPSGNYTRIEPYVGTAEYVAEGVSVFNRMRSGDFIKKALPLTYEFMEKYKATGYTDVLVPQTDEIGEYITDLKTFALDAYIKIITGEENIEYFDKFVADFYAMGGQTVLESINTAAGL